MKGETDHRKRGFQQFLCLAWLLLFAAGCTMPTRGPGISTEAAVNPDSALLPDTSATPAGDEAYLPAIPQLDPNAPQGGAGQVQATGAASRAFLPQIHTGPSGGDNPDGSTPPADAQPTLTLAASAPTVAVGQTLTVTAQVQNIGLPYFYLHLKTAEMSEAAQVARVTYDNQVTSFSNPSVVLAFASATGNMSEAVFVLQGAAPGVVELNVSATGEVHTAGGGTWSGTAGTPLSIEVTP